MDMNLKKNDKRWHNILYTKVFIISTFDSCRDKTPGSSKVSPNYIGSIFGLNLKEYTEPIATWRKAI